MTRRGSNFTINPPLHYYSLSASTLALLLLLVSILSVKGQNSFPYTIKSPDLKFLPSSLTVATNFLVFDNESAADELTLLGHSSNTNFVRDEDIVFTGSGSNRVITVSRMPDVYGTANISVTVSDPQGASSIE